MALIVLTPFDRQQVVMSCKKLLLISNQSSDRHPLSAAEQVMFSALQGLANSTAAGFGDEGVYCLADNFNGLVFQPAASELWLEQIGIPHHRCDPWALLTTPSTIRNYILFDLQANPGSANAASSLSGVLKALPVDVSLQAKVNEKGFTQLEDVRTWSLSDVLAKYPGRFNRTFAVELNTGFTQGAGIGWGPRDYAVANNALVFFGDDERQAVMDELGPSAAIYGWGPVTAAGEEGFISQVGQRGNYYVAADHAFNLSVFSRLPGSSLPVPGAAPGPGPAIGGKCVAFFVSDGDNLQWLLNRGNYAGWWGSPVRGTVPLGWTMSPALYALAAPVWNYYVGSLTDQDEIICGASGIGYVYDNITHSRYFADFLAKTSSFMEAAKITMVDVFGLNYQTNRAYLDGFTAQPAVDGVFYTSYSPWVVPPNPKNVISHGKPVVPNTIDLSDNADQAVQQILSDPDPDSTFAVYVNAWGNQNNPLETVQSVYQQLTGRQGISIVKPSQLLERVRSLNQTGTAEQG
ncbi:MAG TPA: hypothetical protein VF006_01525 [Longimicrobium sp.]